MCTLVLYAPCRVLSLELRLLVRLHCDVVQRQLISISVTPESLLEGPLRVGVCCILKTCLTITELVL